MKWYSSILQIVKGFLFGALGFLLILESTDIFAYGIPFFSFSILSLLDNMISGHKFETIRRTKLSVSWRMSTVEQLFFNLFLAIGFYVSLLLFIDLFPLYMRTIYQYEYLIAIPIYSIIEYRRLKDKEQKEND